MSKSTESFARLSVPVPPELDRACGYRGRARYLGMYWDRTEDKFAWYDGRVRVVGTVFSAWHTYSQHPFVSPALRNFEFGANCQATHMFLLDRVRDTARVGAFTAVETYLDEQWNVSGVEVEPPQYLRNDGFFDQSGASPASTSCEELNAVESIIRWLNANPPAATPFWLKIIQGKR